MKSLHFNISIIVSAFAFYFIHIPSTAAFGDNCEGKFGNSKAETLDQMIDQSEFIGLYKAIESVDGKFKTGGHFPHFTSKTRLSLSTNLTKEAPEKLELYGKLNDTSSIPSSYFHMKDIHGAIVDKDYLVFGSSYEIMLPDGTCTYETTFIEGYEYLVFGNANSRASIEPILHRKFDPLFLAVQSRIRSNKK